MGRAERERHDADPPGGVPGGLPSLEALLSLPAVDAEEFSASTLLRIRPMNLAQTVEVWRLVDPTESRTLLVSGGFGPPADGRGIVEGLDWILARGQARLPLDRPASGGEVARSGRLPRPLLLEQDEIEWIVEFLPWTEFVALRIDGPVEPCDVAAIERVIAAGRTAIEGDLRAIASLRILEGGGIEFASRSTRSAIRLVAEDLAFYLAAVIRRDPCDVARPSLHQVERLLERTGSMTVRPQETEVYPQWVDVGVTTRPDLARPADASLIYDLPSDSWHDR